MIFFNLRRLMEGDDMPDEITKEQIEHLKKIVRTPEFSEFRRKAIRRANEYLDTGSQSTEIKDVVITI